MTDTLNSIAGVAYADTRLASGLAILDAAFHTFLSLECPEALSTMQAMRSEGDWSRPRHSEFIMQCAPLLGRFIEQAFSLEAHCADLQQAHQRCLQVMQFKKQYMLRVIKPRCARTEPINFSSASDALADYVNLQTQDWQAELASWALPLLDDKEQYQTELTCLQDWCIAAALTRAGQAWVGEAILFDWPERLDLQSFVFADVLADGVQGQPASACESRSDFNCQDAGLTLSKQQSQAHYCIYCHEKSGDYCATGFPVKKHSPESGYRHHAAGELMLGCPLEEHVSEMHALYASGLSIAALAAVMVNNPMCAMTGHRICNDCMKSCIYQKQSPVNTPGVETGVLKTVLALPWGVEIVDLLMRWNPLRQHEWVLQESNGRQVAVMGLGPAGLAMTHHLLMRGCSVVGFDGASIQALPASMWQQPIRDITTLQAPLSERPMRGLGGVAEYGITVRWDKNFLTLMQALFARRPHCAFVGSVRFGGTLRIQDFWPLGFDHLCLSVGAGLPHALSLPNAYAVGMRQASDFLMMLHLAGTGRDQALSQFSMRLPVVVIGGGLTAVDTATEAQTYYLQLIEQVWSRYQACLRRMSLSECRSHWSEAQLEVLDEWLQHAELYRSAKHTAAKAGEAFCSTAFCRRFGGVTLIYRRSMQSSPAYRCNHDELQHALNAGILYRESCAPKSIQLDAHDRVAGLSVVLTATNAEGQLVESGETFVLPAKTVLNATGSRPNVAYEYEHQGSIAKRQKRYVPHHLQNGEMIADESSGHFKDQSIGMLANAGDGQRHVSMIGDLHPRFHGTVVKAIASAQYAAPQIMASLQHLPIQSSSALDAQLQACVEDCRVTVLSLTQIEPGRYCLLLRAPLAARRHCAGQFYRVKRQSQRDAHAEGVALIAAQHDQTTLSFIVTPDTVSHQHLLQAKVGEDIDLMGPTGAWSPLPSNPQTVLVIGDKLALPYCRSVASHWQANGHTVCWLMLTHAAETPIDTQWIPEGIAIWQVPITHTSGPQLQAEIAAGLLQCCVGEQPLPIQALTAVHVIANHDILRAVRIARQQDWQGHIPSEAQWVGAVYGPMQCMLKGICAQCLQWQIDPATGERKKTVYACSWQHQPMQLIDIEHLATRQAQDATLERLTKLWYDTTNQCEH